jgi:hypothetical protein
VSEIKSLGLQKFAVPTVVGFSSDPSLSLMLLLVMVVIIFVVVRVQE